MGRLVSFCILGISALGWADEGIFRNKACRDFLASIPSVEGSISEESTARQARLEWLRHERSLHLAGQSNLSTALQIYGRFLAVEVDDRIRLWHEAIRSMSYQRDGRVLDPDDPLDSAAALPSFVSYEKPPSIYEFSSLRDLAKGVVALSTLREFISLALVALPSNKRLDEMDDLLLENALEIAVSRYNQYQALLKRNGTALLSKTDYEVWKLLDRLLDNPRLNPVIVSQITRHLDFLDKYRFAPDQEFRNFLQVAEESLGRD